MSTIRYAKLVGTGNDFVLIDARARAAPSNGEWPRLARQLCSSTSGEGTDGLLVLGRSRRADVRMRIFNPDGSEPAMCGNGIRCLAWFAHRAGAAGRRMTIETAAGVKRAVIRGRAEVRVDMGVPIVRKRLDAFFRNGGRPVDANLVDSGVPHLVCWVRDPSKIAVDRVGRRLRHDPRLGAAGANVDFTRVARTGPGRATLEMRTFERGVEAETRACGTGAVAAAVAHVWRTLTQAGASRAPGRWRVDVRVPGGTLRVDVSARRAAGRVRFGPAVLEGEARQLSPRSNGAGLHGRRRG